MATSNGGGADIPEEAPMTIKTGYRRVQCSGPTCSRRRVHHERPDTPRGIQYAEVPIEHTGLAFCSLSCKMYWDGTGNVWERQDKEIERLREAGSKICEGFDQGVFVRSTVGDGDSAWAIKLFPYLRAIAVFADGAALHKEEAGDD